MSDIIRNSAYIGLSSICDYIMLVQSRTVWFVKLQYLVKIFVPQDSKQVDNLVQDDYSIMEILGLNVWQYRGGRCSAKWTPKQLCMRTQIIHQKIFLKSVYESILKSKSHVRSILQNKNRNFFVYILGCTKFTAYTL